VAAAARGPRAVGGGAQAAKTAAHVQADDVGHAIMHRHLSMLAAYDDSGDEHRRLHRRGHGRASFWTIFF
jgi:hypothetical protein